MYFLHWLRMAETRQRKVKVFPSKRQEKGNAKILKRCVMVFDFLRRGAAISYFFLPKQFAYAKCKTVNRLR